MALLINFKDNELSEYLRVDPGSDTDTIEEMKKAAMDEAEGFLNTDFSILIVNADGSTTTQAQEAPPKVKQWVKNRIGEMYENRGNEPEPNFKSLQRFRKLPFRG